MAIKLAKRGRESWYDVDGQMFTRVTDVCELAGAGFGAGSGWAAKQCAAVAIARWDELVALDPSKRYDLIKSAPWSARTSAATRGTNVHLLAEQAVSGAPVEVPDAVSGWVKQAVRFMDDYQVTPLLSERPVASRAHRYAGTFDLIARVPNVGRVLIDYKTGANIYPAPLSMQFAAYRYAEVVMGNDDDEEPMPEVDACVVVHIQEDDYAAYIIEATEEQHRTFLYAKELLDHMNNAVWLQGPQLEVAK